MLNQEPPRKPRGVRNNNPGNIRYSDLFTWRGQVGVDSDGFCEFLKPEYGIRAIYLILRHYQKYHGDRTVAELIRRYAPPTDDNDTAAYISFVARSCEWEPDVVLPSRCNDTCIVRAIVEFECGFQPYLDSTYHEAYNLATEC